MSLGTFDRTPPPFFRQGPSALTKLVFFTALSIFLMATDTRFGFLETLRSTLATALLPLQRAADVPRELLSSLGNHLGGLQDALSRERSAKAALAQQADRAALADELARENARLRGLLELRPALTMRSTAAEITRAAADPYSRKVIIDRGSAHGIRTGSAVINEVGFLGQVTRVHPLTSEVTLLTDRDAAIPVLNLRTQQRSAAFGGAGGGANPSLELRFMAGNADIQVGDALVTSGLDGLFPPGLPVARVALVERRADTGFARIGLTPVAFADAARYVLVLEPRDLTVPPKAADRVAGAADQAAAAASAASAAATEGAASILRPR
jgi:rod shape-determining protein MreC